VAAKERKPKEKWKGRDVLRLTSDYYPSTVQYVRLVVRLLEGTKEGKKEGGSVPSHSFVHPPIDHSDAYLLCCSFDF